MVLIDAKITGVQNSSILGSSNVFKMISVPIPFKSPTEIPTFISSAFFINILSLYHAGYRDDCLCKFNHLFDIMFTGIIEDLGVVTLLERQDDNLHITLKSVFTSELKIDQSVAHNGVCLTVIFINDDEYTVTAIKETLDKSNMKSLKVNDVINLERAMKLGDRLDGHIVQGHVDQTAICTRVESKNGSWEYTFEYDESLNNLTIEKGSITVNGVSLTVINSGKNYFSVAIIPFTYEHTNFNLLEQNSIVNLEFDVLGKYVQRLMAQK